MSGKTHKKRSGHRKAKEVAGMRADEQRRHTESGVGHTVARGEPPIGHTRHQQGEPLPLAPRVNKPDRKRMSGRPRDKIRTNQK